MGDIKEAMYNTKSRIVLNRVNTATFYYLARLSMASQTNYKDNCQESEDKIIRSFNDYKCP